MLQELRALDAWLAQHVGPIESMRGPGARPTPLATLGETLIEPALSRELATHLAAELRRTAEAIQRNFPENIFWDLDYLVATLVRTTRERGIEALTEQVDLIVALNDAYGTNTSIRFCYVHDFLYGYDWAKWVQRNPAIRKGVLPFDPCMLRALMERASELRTLIAVDDPKYPKLSNLGPRNPFPFRRTPEAERSLHHALAARAEVPLEAWRADTQPYFGRPFAQLREEQAKRLGLGF